MAEKEFNLNDFEDEDVFGDLFWDGERFQQDESKLVLHREDGPAIIRPDGTKMWFLNGKRHREDGPAVISDRSEEWWVNGKLHREDGPALVWDNGTKVWYLNGKMRAHQNGKRK